jgi:hypothetical protein
MRDKIIQIGISERVFYVIGALMAQTIEERMGKSAIVESVSKGPMEFLETYNSIASSDKKINL